MAITVASVGSASREYSSANISVSAFTPSAGSMLLLVATGQPSGGDISGITGHTGGAVWVEIATVGTTYGQMWACFVGDGEQSSSAVTITASNSDRFECQVLEITGVDTSGTVANAFGTPQSTSVTAAGAFGVTLGAFSDATNNLSFAWVAGRNLYAPTWDDAATWTVMTAVGVNRRVQCAYLLGQDTSVDTTWPASTPDGSLMAVEIKAASSSTPKGRMLLMGVG